MQRLSRRMALEWLGAGAICAAVPQSARAVAAAAPPVRSLKITVLSTMLAEAGLGEWGYSALVEADGRKILFDTGAHPGLVLDNARELKLDLGEAENVVLSHNHDDHTGGLVSLRRGLMADHPRAITTAHLGAGAFIPRLTAVGVDENSLTRTRPAFEQLGGRWIEHAGPVELAPGVWFTGPVPRVNDERNWSPGGRLPDAQGRPGAEDNIPEDSSLVFDTPKGLVILTGCGHAGVVNICQYARRIVRDAPIDCLIGGLHLFKASDAKIAWTAGKLRDLQVRGLLAGHCTGIEATYRLRAALGLTRATAVVSAVGSGYSLEHGIAPGELAA